MTNLEVELSNLKDNITEMMHLVESQLIKSQQAFALQDVGLAKEIHQIESRVDAQDLLIDKACENIIALYNPVASDLRFVLASFKIVAHLERIGDHADKIARYVRKKQIKNNYDKELLDSVRFNEMFETAINMVNMAIRAFVEEDSKLARKVFSEDVIMNEIYQASCYQIDAYTSDVIPHLDRILYLFSIINKLERVGDLSKNIAEETIFYTDAKTLRHQKLKKREE
ncbi:MAG: phosphate signaling complex protein PhoU [Saprospiraceae bacterium]|nr:phosphate signaling complex protein PhoU [Saprospiraceae bacterium]